MPNSRTPTPPAEARYFVWRAAPGELLGNLYHLVVTPQCVVKYHAGFTRPAFRSGRHHSDAISINDSLRVDSRESNYGWQEVTFEGFLMVMNAPTNQRGLPRGIRDHYIEGGSLIPEEYPDPVASRFDFPFVLPPPPTLHKVGVPKGKLP